MELNQLSSQIIKAAGNYLRLSKKPLGLLINFNEAMLKDGITRIINSNIISGISVNSSDSDLSGERAREFSHKDQM